MQSESSAVLFALGQGGRGECLAGGRVGQTGVMTLLAGE